MPLSAASRLGAYEVQTPLGAGGMGEVYLARDTRLRRDVAIKVLPADLRIDERRRRRLLQEAQSASALNHPNIVTIYGIESAGQIDFIVMEYVRGTTLDGLIPSRGFRLEELLRIAMPIADAVAAAHARGVIHRDLKPSNIMVGAGGAVKVLDFGLARLLDTAEGSGESTDTYVRDAAGSAPGHIAGTAPYMSPEQATGGTVDARSDIFSFGAVLYEMATGRRAFAGGSTADTLAAVIQAQPTPPTQIATALPRELERLILRCLRKEPKRRYQTMLDVSNELQEIKEESSSGGSPAVATVPRRHRHVAAAAGLGLALVAAAGWVFWQRGAVESPPMRVSPLTALEGWEMMPTLSPDGDQVAFARNADKESENFDIYVTIVGSATVRRLTTDPAFDGYPSWSPDGRQIAFVRYQPNERVGRVYLASPLGGEERKLSDFGVTVDGEFFSQISWSPDGRFIAAARASPAQRPGESTGIYLIPAQGGEPRLLTHARTPASHRDPAFSRDGRRLAYIACDACCAAICDVMTVELDSELAAMGPPRQLTSMATQMYGLAWARGDRAVVFGTDSLLRYLWRVGIDEGRPPERVEVAGLGARRPAAVASRDRLVFSRSTHDVDIHALKPPATAPRATIVSSFPDMFAAFSPDGRRIAFSSARLGEAVEIWVAADDGSSPQQLTRGIGRFQCAPSWAPDGRTIAFMSQGADGLWNIWTVDAEGATPRQITSGSGNQERPSWSNDGQWIYFSQGADTAANIWRVAVSTGRRQQITHSGGAAVGFESADGKHLLYQGSKQRGGTPLMSVPLTGGSPRQLVDCVWGFSVGLKGAYYYPCTPPEAATRLSDVRLMDPDTGQDRLIARLAGVAYVELFWGPHASPDGTTLYGRTVSEGEDLMVIENFN